MHGVVQMLAIDPPAHYPQTHMHNHFPILYESSGRLKIVVLTLKISNLSGLEARFAVENTGGES